MEIIKGDTRSLDHDSYEALKRLKPQAHSFGLLLRSVNEVTMMGIHSN